MFMKHEVRTPKRTAVLIEALQSLGRVLRINLTLWLLVTEHSAGDVSCKIQEKLKSESRSDDAGDIFVIDASAIACNTSEEVAGQLESVFFGRKTYSSPAASRAKIQPPISKSSHHVQSHNQTRREQIAEEYGVKPTDAMLRRVSGSFESGKR